MGIQARCPNGHDVRVKDRFAGKKAHCPECGATFRVPGTAERPGATTAPETASTAASGPEAPALPLAVIVSLDGDYASGLPRATPLDPDRATGAEPSTTSRKGVRSRPTPPAAVAEPQPPSTVEPPAANIPAPRRFHAVIAEAVDVEWNVALPGGDPSEPLSADMLQEWLDAGDATGEELVWRQDWPDWVPIRLVFPEHLPPSTG